MTKKMLIITMLVILFVGVYHTIVHAKDPIGYVASLTGEASVMRAGESQKSTLELNSPLYLGDTIQTGPESRVQVLMEDDSLLNLGEKAVIIIQSHLYQPEKNLRDSIYNLLRGKVRIVAGKLFSNKASRLEVESPTSVIGIRMTEFVVWVVSRELTMVIGIDGEVVAKNVRPDLVCKETISAGNLSRIAKDTCPTTPTETPPEMMEEILLDTEAYMLPPGQEMPSSVVSLSTAVESALASASDIIITSTTDIVETGMMGTTTPQTGVDIASPTDSEGGDMQLDIPPGTGPSPQSLPPASPRPPTVLPPLLPPLLPLPPPPPIGNKIIHRLK